MAAKQIRRPYLEHARLYERHWLSVIPCARLVIGSDDRLQCACRRGVDCDSPGKYPREPGWREAEPENFRNWGLGGQWNLGIKTGVASGIVALDIDPRHGGDQTLADLEQRHGRLPKTWRFLTGGGGTHILFAHPGGTLRNSAARIGPGIDVRGDGGFIVAPPSLHISGRRYAISPDHYPDDLPLAPMPGWLSELAMPPPPSSPAFSPDQTKVVSDAYVEAAVRNAVQRVTFARDGERNVTLNKEAYGLARFILSGNLTASELTSRLAYAAASAGLGDHEIVATIRSAIGSRR